MARLNDVKLLGIVCSDIQYKILANGTPYAKYQLAVQREHKSKEADFPYVVSFGKQAENDYLHLRKGSQCLVNGRLQTRIINQQLDCSKCGNKVERNGLVVEVIADSVEYLKDCVFKKNDKDMEIMDLANEMV